jgi:hypothetical protein
MKPIINFYQKSDKYVFYSSFTAIFSILIIINAFAWYYPDLPSQIPIYYALPWGDSQMGELSQFAIMPFIIVLIWLSNLFITWHLHDSQVVLKRLLAGTTITSSIILTITAVKILRIFV